MGPGIRVSSQERTLQVNVVVGQWIIILCYFLNTIFKLLAFLVFHEPISLAVIGLLPLNLMLNCECLRPLKMRNSSLLSQERDQADMTYWWNVSNWKYVANTTEQASKYKSNRLLTFVCYIKAASSDCGQKKDRGRWVHWNKIQSPESSVAIMFSLL